MTVQQLRKLISAVDKAPTHDEADNAYMEARKPCRESGMMGDLLHALDAAKSRLGERVVVPIVGIDHYGISLPK